MNLPLKPLQGTHIVSLALNLPGPAALVRLHGIGAQCTKVHGPAGDPMAQYSPGAYAQLHSGVRTLSLDLKTPAGQTALHRELASAQVLLTSFRPSALKKLQLDWARLHHQHPQLSMVCIVGSRGARAEEPGHDLTYLAEHGLVTGTHLPATLYADMAGALMASEAVLQAVLVQKTQGLATCQEVALADAAAHLALPRAWGLSQPGGVVGGAHAGYRVYPCLGGRVAVAALEPHFAKALCQAAGLQHVDMVKVGVGNPSTMLQSATQQALSLFFGQRSCAQLSLLAAEHDLPLLCMPDQP
jgi:crotonobetainyl-CoA:carnitine CoA-transferase CaiB-like acyl-CoA transferase